jgi:hypothetical protein
MTTNVLLFLLFLFVVASVFDLVLACVYLVEFVMWLISKATSRSSRSESTLNVQSRLRREQARARLTRFRRAKSTKIATWLTLGIVTTGCIMLWWTIHTAQSETESVKSSAGNGEQSPNPAAPETKWQLSFFFRKTETGKTEFRWKLPFKKREKTEDPAKEPQDDKK